jgi:hypothetical protein
MASPGATARYFDLHPVEFLEGMSDLDDEVQVAVYCIVIMLIYARRGPVANDAKWIAGLAKVRYRTTCRKALDALVAKGKLFVDEDGQADEPARRKGAQLDNRPYSEGAHQWPPRW